MLYKNMGRIRKLIIESAETKIALAQDNDFLQALQSVGNLIIFALEQRNKLLIAGNGGSAADAQHFAAELAGKFMSQNRPGLPAIALTTNTSNITAIGNDFGYEFIFSRQLEGLADSGDIVFGISTSGNSKNILEMFKEAKRRNLNCVALLGGNGGLAKELADHSLVVPSYNTQNIQESHIMIIHILCDMIEERFKRNQE